MDQEQDLRLEEWEAAVGKIVTSIARVEGELLLIYEMHFSRTMFKKDKLAERVDRIERLYNENCGKTRRSKELFKAFRVVVKLRNLVAHNPVYYDSEHDGFKITNGLRKDEFVEVTALQEESKQAFKSCTELTVLLRIWANNN